MSLVTTAVKIVPASLPQYFRELDKQGIGYHLAGTNIFPDGRMEFELWADGSDHKGTKVTLLPDGTWSAITDVIICETPDEAKDAP